MEEYNGRQKGNLLTFDIYLGKVIAMVFTTILVRLAKWFGERPGKKKDDPPTPEEEEAQAAVRNKIKFYIIQSIKV